LVVNSLLVVNDSDLVVPKRELVDWLPVANVESILGNVQDIDVVTVPPEKVVVTVLAFVFGVRVAM
jgi:hypothetical protein